ncbi:MAG: signal recognition particle protein [Chloroflexi bacterium]|nr:signal recognition particle protein [Chloroflexota bacterium]
MFESLTDKLQGVFQQLGRRGTVSESDLDEALREVRLALLEADVNFKVVKKFVTAVRERAAGEAVLKSVTPVQQIIAVVNDELVRLLGGKAEALARSPRQPTVILLVGLQGTGKTTTAAKLAVRLLNRGDKPLLVAADIYRPAAVEQLRQLGQQAAIEVYAEGTDVPPATIVENGIRQARKIGASVVIVDTAGRLHVDEEMMAEVADLKKRFEPAETLLVVDAMTGQDAVTSAQAFHKAVSVSGLILTKMDGDARGGAALSIRVMTDAPVKFLGTGERIDALEVCHPDRLAARILGMGDVVTLVEKAKEQISESDVKSLRKRMQDGTFGLDDFLEQFRQLERMGPMSQVLGMLPGMGAVKGKLNLEELDGRATSQIEAIINSMTPQERRHPDMINASRRLRIARGSGTTIQDVNQLLNQYKEAKKIMKAVASGKVPKLAIPALRQ